MTREELQTYIDHFNNKQYEKVGSYFDPDIVVEYFSNPQNPEAKPLTVHGPKAFIEQYTRWADYTREVLEIGDFLSEGNLLFVELYTEFHFERDMPDYFGQSMKKGDVVIMTNWVLYRFNEKGKMKHIRVAHFRMHDPKTARL